MQLVRACVPWLPDELLGVRVGPTATAWGWDPGSGLMLDAME